MFTFTDDSNWQQFLSEERAFLAREALAEFLDNCPQDDDDPEESPVARRLRIRHNLRGN